MVMIKGRISFKMEMGIFFFSKNFKTQKLRIFPKNISTMDDQTANTTISTSLSTSPPNSMLKQPVKSILKNKSSPTVQRIEKEKKASAA